MFTVLQYSTMGVIYLWCRQQRSLHYNILLWGHCINGWCTKNIQYIIIFHCGGNVSVDVHKIFKVLQYSNVGALHRSMFTSRSPCNNNELWGYLLMRGSYRTASIMSNLWITSSTEKCEQSTKCWPKIDMHIHHVYKTTRGRRSSDTPTQNFDTSTE